MAGLSCRSMRDVVVFAMDKESRARDFYIQCRDMAQKKGLREFFQEMADEEEKHRRLLEDLDLSQAQSFERDMTEDLHLSDFLVDIHFSRTMSYQEALIMAMKKEEKAHAFYSSWQKQCTEDNTASIFSRLADEELKHKRKIEEIYDTDILQAD